MGELKRFHGDYTVCVELQERNIVAGFFDKSVNDVIEAIDNERFACSKNISVSRNAIMYQIRC